MELRIRYTRLLRSSPTQSKMETWLSEIQDLLRQFWYPKIEGFDNVQAVVDFLVTILPISPYFARDWISRLRHEVSISLIGMIHGYRSILKSAEINVSMLGKKSHFRFLPRDWGKSANSKERLFSTEMLVQWNHIFIQCCYVNEKIRPDGRRPTPKIEAVLIARRRNSNCLVPWIKREENAVGGWQTAKMLEYAVSKE